MNQLSLPMFPTDPGRPEPAASSTAGDPALTPAFAAAAARLSPEIRAIRIETPAQRALQAIIDARHHAESVLEKDQAPLDAYPEGLLHDVYGGPQTGKTHALKVMAETPDFSLRRGRFAFICPALSIEVMKGADGDAIVTELLRELARRLGVAESLFVSRSVADNRATLRILLRRHRVRWIFIDQVERARMVVDHYERIGALDLFALLTIDYRINVVVGGNAATPSWVASHARLKHLEQSRQVFDPLPVSPMELMADFVGQFQSHLRRSLSRSGLTNPDTLVRLHIASHGGVQGALCRLLRRATIIAIGRNHRTVHRHHLSAAYCSITGEPDDRFSLFRVKNLADRRPGVDRQATILQLGAPTISAEKESRK